MSLPELNAIPELFDRSWALVTAGDPENYNTMTISWGGLGTLWELPVATVYVKPIRYTHDYLENSDWFTVSFFPEEYRKDLALLGRESGRDGDKVAKTRLTPVAVGESTGFAQASATLLCRKIYRQDLTRDTMPAEIVRRYYDGEEPHTMYIGEIVGILPENNR